ncbi:TPA: tyrosine-type recombinase/integrase [Pasteurella multocida]|nr:tyrosine-type recombinase/integrase [Pasteurella multocida]
MMFKEVADSWLAYNKKVVKPKTFYFNNHIVYTYLTPFFNRKCGEIIPKEILDLTLKLSSALAIKCTSVLSQIFNFGRVLGGTFGNPAYLVRKFLPKHYSDPFPCILSPKGISKLIIDINELDRHRSRVNALKILLFTAQRRSEIVLGMWDEIDFENKIWTIPADRMKMKRPHRIPISKTVFELLKKQQELDSRFIFPSKMSKDRHISHTAPTTLLHEIGYKKIQSVHGFRTMFASLCSSSRLWSYWAIEKQLSHKITGIHGFYNRVDQMGERIEMMEWYDDYLNKLSANEIEFSPTITFNENTVFEKDNQLILSCPH